MVKPRELKADEVEFEESDEVDPCSGLEGHDDEQELRDRLNRGDNSAWCVLTVEAKWKGHVGHASLGGFSFPEDNSGLQNQEYAKDDYEELRSEALADLNQGIQKTWKTLSELLEEA